MDNGRNEQDNLLPRKPNIEELKQLADCLTMAQTNDLEDRDIWIENLELLERSYISVFDYVSTCPGYIGKIYMVVYPSDPSYYELYVPHDIKKDELCRLSISPSFALRDTEDILY